MLGRLKVSARYVSRRCAAAQPFQCAALPLRMVDQHYSRQTSKVSLQCKLQCRHKMIMIKAVHEPADAHYVSLCLPQQMVTWLLAADMSGSLVSLKFSCEHWPLWNIPIYSALLFGSSIEPLFSHGKMVIGLLAGDTPGSLIYSLRIEECDPGLRAPGGDMPVMTQYDTGMQSCSLLLGFC